MDEILCKAASEGDIHRLHQVLREDSLILDKILSGSFKPNPLHVAISRNQAESVKLLLRYNKDLAEVLESGRSPLHLAAAKGNVDIMSALVDASRKMCFARDKHGMNPVHVAAVEGNVDVLAELVQASPHAAQVKLDGNETILHLCIKHGQLKSFVRLMETDVGSEFINSTDSCGNTILHVAVSGKNFDIVKHVTNLGVDQSRQKLNVDAVNAEGNTALDIALLSRQDQDFKNFLVKAKCRRTKDTKKLDWLSGKRETLMVVASLIATMAFQAVVSPPAGVWQENIDGPDGHRAGEAVMAYNYPKSFTYFLRVNTIAFIMSLSSIFLLLISDVPLKNRFSRWLLVVITWLTITSTAIMYGFSITVITPKRDRKSLSSTITVGVIVWCSVMAVLLVYHTYKLIKEAGDHSKNTNVILKFGSDQDQSTNMISANGNGNQQFQIQMDDKNEVQSFRGWQVSQQKRN